MSNSILSMYRITSLSFKLIAYYVVLLLTSSYCYSQVFVGPVSTGSGGAGRAATEVGETLMLNPATIAHSPEFSFYTYYADGYWSQELHERTYAISMVDNHEDTLIPGGVTYVNRKRHFQGIGSVEEKFGQITIANFISRHIAFGVAVTYLQQDFLEDYTQWNGNIGLLYNPNSSIGLGLSALNILKPDEEIPEFLQENTNIGMGFTYLFDKFFKFKADIVTHDEESGWENEYLVGLETLVGRFGAFRLGWNKSEVTTYKYYTIGIGFNGPRFRLDYSYQQKDTRARGGMHSVDFRVPL